jgi:hypothetical protein
MNGIPQDNWEAVGVSREQTDSTPIGDQGVDVVDDRRRRINASDVCAVDRAGNRQRIGAAQLEDARELIAGFDNPGPIGCVGQSDGAKERGREPVDQRGLVRQLRHVENGWDRLH